MAKCVLYSTITADFRKDMKLLTGKDDFSVITIPSYAPMYNDRVLYRNPQNWYRGVKWDIVNTWDYDVEEFMDDILGSYDVLHLPGGNTWAFLYMLRVRNLLPAIKRFSDNGGVIIGESAGSIIMTPNIEVAKFADRNIVSDVLDSTESLGLVPFTIKPHWQAWWRKWFSFKKFADEHHIDVVPICDGERIIVNGDDIQYNNSWMTIRGKEG